MKVRKSWRESSAGAALCRRGPACSKPVARRLRTALPLLLLFTLPAVALAQFDFTTNNGTITITGYTGPGGAVTIPSTTNGLAVSDIGDGAFLSCTNVTSVTIPNTVSNMGICVFWGCTSLASATLGNSLTSIGDFAFSDCFNLASLTVPASVTNIGFGAFDFCTSLTTMTIPGSVTTIAANAFYRCGSLASIFFKGNSPSVPDATVFAEDDSATVYYLPGTTNWGPTFGGAPAVLCSPLVEADASFGVRTNRFGFNITGVSNIPVVVEAGASLGGAGWTVLQTCTLTNGSIYFSDAQWMNYPARFYRIRSF